jgi:hypothetical protein
VLFELVEKEKAPAAGEEVAPRVAVSEEADEKAEAEEAE